MDKKNNKTRRALSKNVKKEKLIFDQNRVQVKEIGMGTFELVNFEHFKPGYDSIFSYDRVFKDIEILKGMIAFVPKKYSRRKK